MNPRLLKAILGKYIIAQAKPRYCHCERVLKIDGSKGIVTAIIETPDGRFYHWILETSWVTNFYGVHEIINYKILREDELNGFTAKDKTLQPNRKRLHPQAS